MSACPQCGTVAKPTDKFCNVCGTPLASASRASAAVPAPAQPPYAPPPPAAAAYGVAPAPAAAYGVQPPAAQYGTPGQPQAQAARCQLGHDIAPGASYCPQGHPIALDQMQFASDAYGGGAPPGYAPQPPAQAFGGPPAASPYGAPPAPPGPPQGYASAPPQQPPPGYQNPAFSGAPYGASPPQAAYAPPGQAAYAPAAQPGYAPSAPAGYAPAQPGYAPAQPGYAPAQPGYAPGAPAYPGSNDTSRDAAPPKVLRGFLVAYGTNPSGEFWPLTAGRHVVGRFGAGDGIDIALQDPTISSRHGALVVDGAAGTITLEDTGSTNGTFVNDEHIGFNGRRELRDGDRLRFGGYTTVVKVIART